MADRILRLDKNEKGRDFVVGDIHGAFDLVLQAMRQASFNPEVDRLFSVGDLIDRGPDSHRCLRFLQQPYVYAVRGNHEQTLLDIHANGEPPEAAIQWLSQRNGFGWWLKTPEDLRSRILEMVATLPYVIEVETERGLVGLIHAEVPRGMDWQTFTRRIEGGCEKTMESCLEGRERFKYKDEDGVPGVGRLFVGHTIHWQGAARRGNVYSIDTGAIFGQRGTRENGSLTMASVAVSTGILSAPVRAPVSLVDLRLDDGEHVVDRPFGNYARPARA